MRSRSRSLSREDPLEKADLRSHLQSEQLDKRPKYTSQHLDTPVVVVSSEVNPWSKTGGLAMVAGSYGYEFAMRGHRTMVVSPRYGDYKDAVYVGYAKIWLDGREHEAGAQRCARAERKTNPASPQVTSPLFASLSPSQAL